MKVKLKKRQYPSWCEKDIESWDYSEPFFVNKRGCLTHRVRGISTISHQDSGGNPSPGFREPHHYSVLFWCGGRANFTEPSEDLVATPPVERLLCDRCEAVAQAAGQKTSDELAGRHVHVGRMKPIRTCCQDHVN